MIIPIKMSWTKLVLFLSGTSSQPLLNIIKDRERERAQGHEDELASITIYS
jgi:hypothetical protein